MRATVAVLTLIVFAQSALPVSAPVIGLAVSQGRMKIDRAPVEGSGNVTEGVTLSSDLSPVRIRLNNGNGATLASNSQARVFQDRIVLEKGQVLSATAGYRAEASGFRAVPSGPGAQAVVSRGAREIQVSAVRGAVKVIDGRGMTIARVPAGRAIRLEPAAGATAGTSSFTGALRRERNRFLLRDEVTDLEVELRGSGLERHTGSRVQATGKAQMSPDGESQIVLVSRVRIAQEPVPQDRPPGGNRPDPEPPKTGMSNGAKVAIIVAVAGGAAGGVIAATGKKSDSVSR